jgi:4-aminobutyrate--pyruvate transaminase
MLANSASARDAAHVLHGYVELGELQRRGSTVITGGKGIYVFDENGTPYIEGAAGMWCTAFGFGEQALIDAAIEQLHKLPYYHTVAYKSVNPAIDLAERLAALVPLKDAKLYFCLSGSEANDFLVKMIRYYNNAIGRPQKKKIIARHGGYHGATIMAASLTGLPANHALFDLPVPGVLHTADPNYFRYALPEETRESFASRLASELEQLILAEGPETIAGFIAEPVTGAGGVIIPPEGYYGKVQAVLSKYDILFLDDEVINGFHRTGALWGCQTTGILPDTMSMAKGLTSAYQPLAAIAFSGEIYEGLEAGSKSLGFFGHGTTYSGHPVGCAVALKVLDLLKERDIAGHVARVSKVFAKRLEAFRDHPLVGDVRYTGLVAAVEFVKNKAPLTFFDPPGEFGRLVRERAEEGYHLICRLLPGSDACAFSPPLIITESEVNEMFDRFGKALDDVTAAWRKAA